MRGVEPAYPGQGQEDNSRRAFGQDSFKGQGKQSAARAEEVRDRFFEVWTVDKRHKLRQQGAEAAESAEPLPKSEGQDQQAEQLEGA